jgi:hypothetical protein
MLSFVTCRAGGRELRRYDGDGGGGDGGGWLCAAAALLVVMVFLWC